MLPRLALNLASSQPPKLLGVAMALDTFLSLTLLVSSYTSPSSSTILSSSDLRAGQSPEFFILVRVLFNARILNVVRFKFSMRVSTTSSN